MYLHKVFSLLTKFMYFSMQAGLVFEKTLSDEHSISSPSRRTKSKVGMTSWSKEQVRRWWKLWNMVMRIVPRLGECGKRRRQAIGPDHLRQNPVSGKLGVRVSTTYNAFNRQNGYGQRVFALSLLLLMQKMT